MHYANIALQPDIVFYWGGRTETEAVEYYFSLMIDNITSFITH